LISKNKPKYGGVLGKPIPQRLAFAALLKANNPEDEAKIFSEWRSETDVERLFLLLNHYEIGTDEDSKWLFLALELARDHVPGFTLSEGKGPGRPRKVGGRLADLMRLPRKPGRPKKERNLTGFLGLVEKTKIEHKLTGRGSDKRALEILLTADAKDKNESVIKVLRDELPYFQKRLSEARKLIPKIRENYPE